jgi:hypothetical protein
MNRYRNKDSNQLKILWVNNIAWRQRLPFSTIDKTSVGDPIRNRRMRMILGLLDPDPDLLVRGMDPDPSLFS